MPSLAVFESNVIHLPNMNSVQGIQWLSSKTELTTTRFPSTTFLFMIVSFPSHFCTWFSMPLSRVMTFYQRKKKKQSVAVSSGCSGLKRRLSPCPNSTDTQSLRSTLTFEGSISTLDVKITTLSSCSHITFETCICKVVGLDSPLFFCHLLWSHQTLHPAWKRSLYFWRYFLFWWLSHHHWC